MAEIKKQKYFREMTPQKSNQSRKKLVEKIRELKKSPVSRTVDARLKEFKAFQKKSAEEVFMELCFCITTANCAAESCIRIQQTIGDGYNNLSEEKLSARLKELGYRFPNKRAAYISGARKHKGAISGMILQGSFEKEIRDWLVKNVLGLGYKEASHFLRNVGYTDLAIIDFHIVDILVEHGIIDDPKNLTKKKYMEIEQTLRELADETDMTLSELDLYLWFLETGKVLK
jgi:N-glycosylase/DNA lyase